MCDEKRLPDCSDLLLSLWTESESCLRSSHSQSEKEDNDCNFIVKVEYLIKQFHSSEVGKNGGKGREIRTRHADNVHG